MRRFVFLAVLAAVTASMFGILGGGGGRSEAATGDNLASFDASSTAGIPPCASGVGTGIAFDGTTLYLSCWGSNVLQRVNAATHLSGGAALTIAGMSDIGAMAYSSGGSSAGKIWACQGGSQVYLIDPGASTSVSQFPVAGCIDGLAYDGVDNTIWASPDADDCIYHYSSTGTPLVPASYCGLVAKLGGFGNSGIAVGGSKLYLGNNGGSQIYQCDKSLVTCTLMSTFPARIEDLECDNVTFPGKSAIWSQDAYDRILNAWEIPAGSCGLGGSGSTPIPGTPNPVGGIAELRADGSDSAGPAAESDSGSSSAGYAAIAGMAVAAGLVLAVAGWYARRRWQQ